MSRKAAPPPPLYSIEAEMSALGAVFYGADDARVAVLDGLRASDWFLPANRILWEALRSLHAAGAPIDIVTVNQALVQSGQLEDVGGIDYLIRVMEFVPGPSNAGYYADLVAKDGVLRAYEEMARTIMSGIHDPALSFEQKRLAVDEAYTAASNGHVFQGFALESFTGVEARPIPWLYKPYLALGTGALLVANPGVGKSCFTYAFAAAVTNGKGPPGFELPEPGEVLLCSSEDDANFVIRPRLDEAGAVIERIFRIPKLAPPMTVDKMRMVIATVKSMRRPLLAIFDPIVEWFPATKNMNAQNEAREINVLFRNLAQECNICVLLVGHANKNTQAELIHRALGSVDFTAFVRSYLFATRVSDTGETAIIHAKTNLRVTGKAIGYKVDDDDKLYWTGDVAISESDVMAPRPERPITPKQFECCKTWLEEQLRTGSMTAIEAFEGAKTEGFSATTVKRAKATLPIRSQPIREQGRVIGWEWSWLDDARPKYWQEKDDPFAED